ncbi:hypothetical protein ACFORO_08575 [Amycolatopsis halotolerans]|uniref:Uncharacterized protein n=1 Tax=Amycolatopsis halotolerans TaxID=330083 RepID=A0ABV7QDC1_9PSEU
MRAPIFFLITADGQIHTLHLPHAFRTSKDVRHAIATNLNET